MNRVMTFILVVVLCGAVLAFGAVEVWAYTIAEVVLFTALFLVLFQQTKQGVIRLRLPVWPLLFLCWVALELVPLPVSLVRFLSPNRWFDAARVMGTVAPKWTTLSIYPHDTQVALLKFVAYLSAFVLAAWLHDSRSRRNPILGSMVALGCFEAGWGMIHYLTGWQMVFGYTKIFYREEATGTYINRDHFAGLLEMVIPFLFALAFYHFQLWLDQSSTRSSQHDSQGSTGAGGRTLFFLVLLCLIVLADIFSQSRAGIAAAIFSILFIAVLTQARIRHKIWGLAVFVLFMATLGYGLWIGLGPVLNRFEQIREPGYIQTEGRLTLAKDSIRLWRDYPLAGTGFGTFGVAFIPFQTTFVTKYVDHAHNDYLETTVETGIAGAVVLFVPIFALFIRMVLSFLDDPRRYRRAITLGCIGSTLAMLLHSVIDFNLHIPANALVFATVLGIGYKTSLVERREEGKGRPQVIGDRG